jgi:DNA-binding XRE family transcriptional regulator
LTISEGASRDVTQTRAFASNLAFEAKAVYSPDNSFKTVSLDTMIDRHIGIRGTPERETFESELRLDLLGYAAKQARLERHLTQEQLGELVGVQKAQISKIENSIKNTRIETVMKVFNALGTRVSFQVEMMPSF